MVLYVVFKKIDGQVLVSCLVFSVSSASHTCLPLTHLSSMDLIFSLTSLSFHSFDTEIDGTSGLDFRNAESK